MNKASTWAALRAEIDCARPERFTSVPSDRGHLNAWVKDDGTLGYRIEGTPSSVELVRFAMWILDMFGDEP